MLLVLFYCINHLLESTNPFSLVHLLGRIFLSATRIRPFYLRSHYIRNSSKFISSLSSFFISTPYQLSSSPIICLHEAIVRCTCVKSLITFWYQLTGICFLNEILLSCIPISWWMNFFCGMVDRRKALFPAGTIVRSLHHPEALTHRETNYASATTKFLHS